MIKRPFLFILFLISASAQSAIFGDGNPDNGIEDQRQTAPKQLLNFVGTIFCDGGLRGTATHIQTTAYKDRSIIVTAAHVLFDRKTGAPFKQCSYRPENRRLSGIGFAAISKHQYQPFSKNKIRQSETDIVFVALQKRAYQKTLKLALPENAIGSNLQLLGYNADSQEISLSDNCMGFKSEFFISTQLLLHNCDALSGASGGPIIKAAKYENDRAIIAVHGGTLFNADSAIAGAEANPDQWINQARKVDKALLSQLELFLSYLAKDFPCQK